MKKRILGKTGKEISEIGFGGWGLGRTWWGPTDDEQSIKALSLAWDKGVTFFDTAYVYGDGHSEKIMARGLKGKPAFIATKIPPHNRHWPPQKGDRSADAFPEGWIRSCTERSLAYLERETLDLQQLHVWVDDWVHSDDWKEDVSRLKKEGKIQAFGVSIIDHQPDSALKLVESGLVDTVQVIFNIFDQSPLERLFPLCRKNKVGVIARVPFDEGGLTGKLTKETKFEGDDFRAHYFRGERLAETVARAEKLKLFLTPETPDLPSLALKFILAHPEVSTVIPGMRSPKHVEANTAVSEAPPLGLEDLDRLKSHAWTRNFYGWWK